MSKSNRFTIKSIVYQLRICKQKANNIAKFGTKAERNTFLWKFVQSNSKSKRFTNSKLYQLGICKQNANDISKFCTKAERNTPLWKFVQRHPVSYEKTT